MAINISSPMAIIHFLNVLEGDCNIIQHDSGRTSVIDVSNAFNEDDTIAEKIVKASAQRAEMKRRTQVPVGKTDYRQKHTPENPISYIKKKLGLEKIFRFIITHPDMDHLDGIRDFYQEFEVGNTWDTANNKEIDSSANFGGYNREDWDFYKNIRDGKHPCNRRTYYDSHDCEYWNQDDFKVLCPSESLVRSANEPGGDIHDLSYVILFTPPKKNGRRWKILFAGDSHDASWEHIIKNNKEAVSDIDVLFAPHHGRDSSRSYEFLETLKPRFTLFGNASSEHLAYSKYPPIRITNNQAGNIVIDVSPDRIGFYVQNYEFAKDFCAHRNWGEPEYSENHHGYGLCSLNA